MKKINKNSIYSNLALPLISILVAFISPLFSQDDSNMANNSTNTESINSEAVTQAQQGNYGQAINRFRTIVSIQDQNVAATYNNLGYTFLLNHDSPNAIDSYKKAIERNPVLVPSLANLGRLLYETGQFKESIVYGEKVITLDPRNTNVREWLPDAYKKAAARRMFELENLKDTDTTKNKNGDFSDSNTLATQSSKRPLSKIELAGLLEFAWDKQARKLAMYGPHTTIPFPIGLSAEIWASPDIRIIGDIKVPNMGINMPYFITSEENVGFIFHSKTFFYGAGIYFSQANFSYDTIYNLGRFIQNSAFPKRADLKLGVIFGFQKEFSSLLFYAYPRLLFQDATTGPQSIEYDRALIKVEYRITHPESKGSLVAAHFELGFGFKTDEFFITEYSAAKSGVTVGHYLGWYDFYIDMAFGKIQPMFDKIPLQFGFLVGPRFYFQDFANKSPGIFGNGQGFAGLVPLGILLGNAFPTYHTASLIFDLYFKQMFFSKVILTEKIGTEIPKHGQPYNGFSASLSVSYTF